jgi:hypothetical protein
MEELLAHGTALASRPPTVILKTPQQSMLSHPSNYPKRTVLFM